MTSKAMARWFGRCLLISVAIAIIVFIFTVSIIDAVVGAFIVGGSIFLSGVWATSVHHHLHTIKPQQPTDQQ